MKHPIHQLAAALFLIALAVPTLPARAAETGWTEVQGGAVRLIAEGPMRDGTYLAGLEFLLDPGWHTYWRAPGEAGIPPQLDFGASINLGSAEVLYPVPERYSDGFSVSIVYHDGVVLPVKVVPLDPAEPVRLDISLFFGVCSDICVPGDARLSLELATSMPADTLAARLIGRDLQRVPGPADGEIAIGSVSLGESGEALIIETATADKAADAELFAAGPEGSYLGVPELVSRDGQRQIWSLPTRGLAVAPADRFLRLVLSNEGRGVERLVEIRPEWLQ